MSPAEMAGLWNRIADLEEERAAADPESYAHDQVVEQLVELRIQWADVRFEALS